MKTFTKRLLGATALVMFAAPAFAEASDQLFLNDYRDKIAAARAEPGVAENGSAELDLATTTLTGLGKALDNDNPAQAAAAKAELDARIETARTRAKIAATKSEIERLKTSTVQRTEAEIAAAQAQAQAATAAATTAKAETAALRNELQDYQMKQTALGATLVLQDVVFETGRADLKPGAADRLRPLAQYLASNSDVKVQIDGHADAQGAASTNQALSERRAQAIKSALAGMNVDAGRIQAIGHGEASPVADNRTAAGRQQNRRVEITLVGQQASGLTKR